jgi:uroporphyrinogen-III synthase
VTDEGPRVAFFRPDDYRAERATEAARERGLDPLSDPILETVPTGKKPRTDGGFIVLTSVTGVELAAETVRGADAVVCAIGPKTADGLCEEGTEVDVVPEEYTSAGLVKELKGRVGGERVEVARSDHGSDELLDGLNDAGAYVHETVLYEIRRPEGGGERTARGLEKGTVDAVLFTSSLTVEHLVEALEETGAGVGALEGARVYAIGEPTRETAEGLGISVDGVPEDETFDSLLETAKKDL